MHHWNLKSLARNVGKRVLIAVSLISLLAPVYAEAKSDSKRDTGRRDHDHGRGGYGRPNPYPYPTNPYPGNDGYYTEYLQAFVNSSTTGGHILQVRQLLNLGYGKFGKTIYQVKIQAKSFYGTAQLLVNNQAVSSLVQISSNLSEISFHLPRHLNRNEIDVRQLYIILSGEVYVSTVGVVIER